MPILLFHEQLLSEEPISYKYRPFWLMTETEFEAWFEKIISATANDVDAAKKRLAELNKRLAPEHRRVDWIPKSSRVHKFRLISTFTGSDVRSPWTRFGSA